MELVSAAYYLNILFLAEQLYLRLLRYLTAI